MRRTSFIRDVLKSNRWLSVAVGGLVAIVSHVGTLHAGIVTFGQGANTFQMEFVTIGNPGNAADTTGAPSPAGAVGYEYGIGKFEVSEDMINKYNANFGTANSLVITKDTRGSAKPATSVSWNEAARFVNWLNTSTGGFAAYKFTTGGVNDDIALWTSSDTLDWNPANQFRSKRAKYVLPDYNEWYKAAYYNPNNSTYYNFTNGSDTQPTAVASGTGAGTAVYLQTLAQGPADVDQAGGLSPYGVMGLGGNVYEWEETSWELSNEDTSVERGSRGGLWLNTSSLQQQSSNRFTFNLPTSEVFTLGFRVAMVETVPEPSMMVIGTLFGLGGLMAKRRMKK